MPYYNSERCFRRYEHAIAVALESYPQCVCFTSPRSLATDQGRCLDAITYYKIERWQINDPVRAARFEDLASGVKHLTTWIENDKVVLGPPQLRPTSRKEPVVIKEFRLPELVKSYTPFGSETIQDHVDPVGPTTAIIAVPRNDVDVLALIDLIDNAVVAVPFCIPNTFLPTVEQHCADRLNVVFNVVNDSIIIQ